MNAQVQMEKDDKDIREVIAEAERIAGVRCFMPWTKFVISVMRGIDLTAPAYTEKPRWWYWDMEQGWVFSFEHEPRIEIEKGRIKSVVVHGTSETRGKKVDDMFDAVQKAGKP